jgi:hypothetical protein
MKALCFVDVSKSAVMDLRNFARGVPKIPRRDHARKDAVA